ncbi:MAG: hypothetical protein K8H89_08705 [Flavobacteriales bacterium]|jgi:hypothetical protein|nr:hypothetical protein [Flavobacteriales bacterium]MCB0759741.1 hypothetical protein [Flavobacteriales bacterium]
MAKKRLTEKDIDQLLAHYRNERRRLGYQMDLVRTAIADLKQNKEMAATKSAASAKAVAQAPKRGPGRPRKDASTVAAPGKPGRPKKRERKERPLNEWDNVVINTINTSGRLLPKEELLDAAKKWASANEPKLSPEEVEAFLTRSLQKLSGKKKLLGTHHSGLRRGYHYGLKDWFFQSSGKLRKQHYDRLVLTPEKATV